MLCCICGHFCLRGRPFDYEAGGGGGGLANFVGTEYHFQYEVGRKIYFQVYQDQNIYFHPQQNFEKASPKKPTDNNKGGGGVSECSMV